MSRCDVNYKSIEKSFKKTTFTGKQERNSTESLIRFHYFMGGNVESRCGSMKNLFYLFYCDGKRNVVNIDL